MAENSIRVASGRLRWTPDGDDLVAGHYRIRLHGVREWELTYRGRPLEVHVRRSKALAWAERHHRETQRVHQISRFAALAGIGTVAAGVSLRWLTEPMGFLMFAVGVYTLLSAAARGIASMTRNLLDPYRTREKWEPPDWYNRHD